MGRVDMLSEYARRVCMEAAARGYETNKNHLEEEMGEALVAIHHLRRGRGPKENVIEEVADVVLCGLAVLYAMDPTFATDMLDKKAAKCETQLNNPVR